MWWIRFGKVLVPFIEALRFLSLHCTLLLYCRQVHRQVRCKSAGDSNSTPTQLQPETRAPTVPIDPAAQHPNLHIVQFATATATAI